MTDQLYEQIRLEICRANTTEQLWGLMTRIEAESLRAWEDGEHGAAGKLLQLSGDVWKQLILWSEEPPSGHTYFHFASIRDFLARYAQRQEWELCAANSQQTVPDVKCVRPSHVKQWSTFEAGCGATLGELPAHARRFKLAVRIPRAHVYCEKDLQWQLDMQLLLPLQQAFSVVDPFFIYSGIRSSANGLSMSAHPDFLLLTSDQEKVLVSVVVKTSDGTCVPADSSLPAEYAAATDGSQLVQSVLQMYSYLGAVPYGVLVTDKQLFCMRREGTELFCSPAIPITGYVDCPAEDGRGGSSAADQQAATGAAEVAQEQLQAAGGRSAGSLTAVAALYCIMRMSQRWWAQQPPPPPQQQLAGAEGKGNSGGGAELVPAAAAAPGAAAGPALPHAAADGSWSSSQLFPFGLDPRVPGGVPPSLGAACMGCVLQGSVGGRPAAVKLVDLWKVPEGREVLQREVRMYQLLQPLQGVYVPHLLAYGFLDGWQYFVATSLEGPPLSKEEGWAMSDADTCEAALAALDAVHQRGVLHCDIELRQFVLASQAAAGGDGGDGGGGDSSGGGAVTGGSSQQQQQQRILLLDFAYAKLVSEEVEETGEEPAALFRRERRKLEALLGWEPPVLADAEAAAAVGGGGGVDVTVGTPVGPAAAKASPPAACGARASASAFPSPPPRLSYGLPYGWRPRPHVMRNHLLLPASRGACNASLLPLRRIL